jgi:WD40 repeat protein
MEAEVFARKGLLQVEHPVTSLDFSSSGKVLASGGVRSGSAESKGYVALWDLPTGNKLNPAPGDFESTVSCVRFSPDGKLLAIASWDGAIYLWDLRNNRLKGEPFRDKGLVSRLAFSSDNKTLASITGVIQILGQFKYDNWITLWDAETGQRKNEPLDLLQKLP